jgi:hypothetical protein
MAAVLVAILPIGCTSNLTPGVTNLFQQVPGTLTVPGGSITVNVSIPHLMRTQGSVGNSAHEFYRDTDVTSVELKLYAKDPVNHAGHDYAPNPVLFTSANYTGWSGGNDADGDRQYTISNIPISATPYIVTGRAFGVPGDLTKTVSGFAYARSSNWVTVSDGTTTYSGVGTTLELNIPLGDAVGAPADVITDFTPGDGTPPISGADT